MKIVQKSNVDFLQTELDKLIMYLNEFKKNDNSNNNAPGLVCSKVLKNEEIQTM